MSKQNEPCEPVDLHEVMQMLREKVARLETENYELKVQNKELTIECKKYKSDADRIADVIRRTNTENDKLKSVIVRLTEMFVNNI